MKNIIYGDAVINISDSLYITLVSMLIVFLILFIISVFLYLFKFIPKEKVTAGNSKEKRINTNKKSVENKVSESKMNEKEKINFLNLKDKYNDKNIALAIMTACIDASEEMKIENIKINYVREIK